MISAVPTSSLDIMQRTAAKAAASALDQLRRGAKDDARTLYAESHSILRELRRHFAHAA